MGFTQFLALREHAVCGLYKPVSSIKQAQNHCLF